MKHPNYCFERSRINQMLSSLFVLLILALGLTVEVNAEPGDLDPTFGNGGQVQTPVGTEDRGNAMVLQPDGKIVVGGRTRPGATYFDYALARYNTDGSLDTSFGNGGTLLTSLFPGMATDDEILALALQPDGKIVAAGNARGTSGAFFKTGIVRYNPNGSLDQSFGVGGLVLLDRAVDRAVVLQPDGKIVCGGGSGEGVTTNFQISRLNTDGSLDPTFGSGGDVSIDFNGSGDGVYGLALQPDGKVVAAGRSRGAGGSDNFAVARLNTDGSLDQSFGTGGKVVTDFANDADFGFAVVLQPDGKIIVSGRAKPGTNIFDFGLVRYNPNGSLDTTFGNAGKVTTNFFTGVDTAFAVKLQSNGKIVAAGTSGGGGGTAFALARYNPNGSLDPTFGNGGLVETFFESLDEAHAMQIQPDGKIVAAGYAKGGGILGQFALARYLGDPPVVPRNKPFDFDGDGKSDIAVYRPSEGGWRVVNSSNGNLTMRVWGTDTDKLVPADYDGDGKTDIAIYRPSEGNWYIIQSSTGAVTLNNWGGSEDIPVPADYDGDGRAEVAVFRPSEGNWYIRRSSDGGVTMRGWGMGGDAPVAGDYDGDGRADIAVFRPSEGNWYVIQSSTGTVILRNWGQAGDLPVPADYDGDGKTDLAVYRSSEGNWYVIQSGSNSATLRNWGTGGDMPVPGDYDGDGRADVAVHRSSEANWYLINSSTNAGSLVQFGANNDQPVASAYLRP